MNGLIDYSNSLSFKVDPEETLAQEAVQVLVERIRALKPRTIIQTTGKIRYTAGVVRLVWNFNLLYAISEGEIKVEGKEQTLIVHYVITFYEAAALSVIPAVGALVIVESVIGKVIGLLLVLIVSYGGNILITILRYNRFINSTIKGWLKEKKTIPISEEQKEWMENPDKCDACGHILTTPESICPDCGLSLR